MRNVHDLFWSYKRRDAYTRSGPRFFPRPAEALSPARTRSAGPSSGRGARLFRRLRGAGVNRPARGRAPSQFVVVRELEPIRDAPGRQLAVRIVDVGHSRRVDVRELVESAAFSGFTRKGICLTAEEFETLFAQRDEVLKLLEGRRS